jgi:hypothetical protein
MSQELVCLAPKTCLEVPELLEHSGKSHTNSLGSITLRKRKDDWESVTTSHPDYIRFYNSLWLVANDVREVSRYFVPRFHIVLSLILPTRSRRAPNVALETF